MSEVYVVGHRNPDTDSVCSAIAYANLKNKITGTEDYHPYRAGQLNEETQFVLKKCHVAQYRCRHNSGNKGKKTD